VGDGGGAVTLFGSYVSFQFLATQYLQSLAGWSPISTALAFPPAGVMVAVLSAGVGPLLGPRGPAAPGRPGARRRGGARRTGRPGGLSGPGRGYGTRTVRSPGVSGLVQARSTSASGTGFAWTAIVPALISSISAGSSAR
jgi:hypothetical protein